MASKLCCTAEDESRNSSPELPNARVTEAAVTTPAKLPLLPKNTPSQNSQFTSAQSEELHELRQIFNNASADVPNPTPPAKAGRTRFIKPSVYSLHSLHKMKSMHSMIRRKFSKDLSKKTSGANVHSPGAKKNAAADPDTVLKQSNDGPNLQLKITKDDLRKDLLSDKNPDEGGYDPDAEVLDDIAKNIVKKTPKRPSIHSIDWSPSAGPSTGSKPTPGSSSKSKHSAPPAGVEPYQIQPPANALSTRFSQVFSTPNLRADASTSQDCRLRRSHSATSMHLPKPLLLSPIRLPSLRNCDQEGVPWSVAVTETLRLSQLPFPVRPISPDRRAPSRRPHNPAPSEKSKGEAESVAPIVVSSQELAKGSETPATGVEIRVQEPTSTTPRPSTSRQGTIRESSPPAPLEGKTEDHEEDGEENPRRSVHLYSMRISHHLRSGSLLSWDSLANAPDIPSVPAAIRDRSVSDLSRISRMRPRQPSRHERQTSSSGFASSRVPSKWGRVVAADVREDKSSTYSSRPQSPPDSFGGSVSHLPPDLSKKTTSEVPVDMKPPRRSDSYPTDNDDTPRPPTRHGLNGFLDVPIPAVTNTTLPNQRSSKDVVRLSRNNSVESTKKSKFREEFSPSPPKKRLITSTSIMRFLNPKRSSIRSHSEVLVKPSMYPDLDGAHEPGTAAYREHEMSKSLEAEKEALGKDKNALPMWERALKNHQDERAAMFLPKNKDLAVHSSPIRERKTSATKTRASMDSNASPGKPNSMNRYSAPLLGPSSSLHIAPDEALQLSTRRTAVVAKDAEVSFSDEIQRRFDQQTDTVETVGAWGRYPSHSRPDRTFSAGHLDDVETRDFALEAAINFAMGKNSDANEDEIDPMERLPSPPLSPGQRKRKKKVGNPRIAKSNSMTFGKNFLKNYTKIFRSQSSEFQKHGHGHRSSVSGGGALAHPELEMLPDVWGRGAIKERSEEIGGDHEQNSPDEEYGPGDKKGKGKVKEEDSPSTHQSLNISKSDDNNLMPSALDGPADSPYGKNSARALSAYYENCLPAYPRASTELDFNPDDFGTPARHSLESRRPSMCSRTMPVRSNKHSRNASYMSHLSVVSNNSVRPSFLSTGEDDNGGVDERSMVSVRRSTMDLITQYKEQEKAERERVLGLMRAESRKQDHASPVMVRS
ncbi:hypothetical protein P280DRAFT_396540 [Massarina eburnea CBS 473.64]|uniref:Uncharacterized protein n=1 Tax=Massarina eburnea CBS 473.64 TaxID=1395130 RepID=A0A6A6S3A9_9PLEO|nr:hypothetical protein P280DRAFT_396540 [Massarina eburnea CBS 473.64]